jgi:hypothetical protein
MKNTTYLILITAVTLGSAASGQALFRGSDTLWIDSVATHSGQKVTLDISFSNQSAIRGIDLPIIVSSPLLMVDSVSYVGGRIDGKLTTIAVIDTLNRQVHLGAMFLNSTDSEVEPGRGLFARMYLTIPDEHPAELIVIDSTHVATGPVFVDPQNQVYTPEFNRGYLDNSFAPALDDSVWLADADISAGESFSIPLSMLNELPLRYVQVPMVFQSDNVVFESVTLTGTRSINAITADADFDNILKRVVLSLAFDDNLLLPAGSGVVAMLNFRCLVAGTTELVQIDTTYQDYNDFYTQMGPLYAYMKAYPAFSSGTVSIEINTSAADDGRTPLPTDLALFQNEPNPFNPATTISFALPARAYVTLDVFNILGQKVRALVDGLLPAGEHAVTFDGRDQSGRELASGVYLYRIKVGDRVESRKMVLMK